jgi:hypothetical protein
MEIKISERILSLGVSYVELDSVMPPQNELNFDKVDYRIILYRLLIRASITQ